jgi:hypothetical protein
VISSIVLASGLVLIYAAGWKARNLATFAALAFADRGWRQATRRRAAMAIALAEAVVGLLLLVCGAGGPAVPNRLHLVSAALLTSTGLSLVAFHAVRGGRASEKCGCMGSEDTVGVSRVRAGLLLLAGIASTWATIAGSSGDSLRNSPATVLAATSIWIAVFVVGSEAVGTNGGRQMPDAPTNDSHPWNPSIRSVARRRPSR